MILSFKHKGLKQFFKDGAVSGIQSNHKSRIRLILGRLHSSTKVQDMDLPGLYLHQLKGSNKERWSVRVSGNWRITFKFHGVDALEVNYEDYH